MESPTIHQILEKISYESRMNMLADLKKLQAGKIELPQFGICGNLPSDMAMWLQDIAQFCPKYSGDKLYPIRGGEDSYTAHQSNGSLWIGPQLEYRQSLIAFAINALEDF